MGAKRIQSIYHQLSSSQRRCGTYMEMFLWTMYLKVKKYGGDNPESLSYVGL